MAQLPTFDNDYPVLGTTNIPTGTPGTDAMGEALGEGADFAAKMSAKIGDQESNLMLMKQASLLNEAKNQTLLEMSKNPSTSSVQALADGFQKQSETIIDNSVLNSADKAKLGIIAQSHLSTVNNASVTYQKVEAKRTNQLDFIASTQSLVSDLQSSKLTGDDAKLQINTWNENAQNAVKAGYITPIQYQNQLNTIHAIHDRYQQMQQLVGEGGTASQYHALHALTPTNQLPGNVPVNHATQFRLDQSSQDENYSDAMASLYQPNPSINMQAVMKMTPSEYSKYYQTIQGVAAARGSINAGVPYPVIKSRIDALQGSSKSLTNQQEGELTYLNNYNNALKNGHFDKALSMTPKGQQIIQQSLQKANAIQNSGVLSPEGRAEQLNKVLNQSITAKVAYAKAQKIPTQYIKPIPIQIANPVQNMFANGGDVKNGMDTLQNLSPSNTTWVANQMSTPAQQEIIHTVGLLKNTANEAMAGTFITANQVGNDYSQLKSENSQGKLTTQAFQSNLDAEMDSNATMKSIRQHLSISPGGSLRVPALRKSVENYVKYLAMQHNDFTGDHLQDYVNKATQMIGSAYQITTGNNFSFVDGELGLTLPQSKAMAAYLTNKTTETILANTASKGQAEANLDMNHLRITNTPDGQLLITDANGNAAYKVPVTQSLIGTATNWYNEHVRKINSGTTLSSVLSNNGLDEKLLP